MDTQIKLINYNGYDQKIVCLDLMTNWTQALFGFREYERCQLTLLTNQEDVYLEVEYADIDGMLRIPPNIPIIIAEEGYQDDGFIPGNYLVRLVIGAQVLEGYFTVDPQNISESDLQCMRDTLERKAKGITRDLYNQKQMGCDNQTFSNDLDLLNYLNQYFEELMMTLNQIIIQPLESLEQQYSIQNISKKPTAKSQRWACTKGRRYNGQGVQQLFYEKEKWLNRDTPENRYVKHILMDILSKTASLTAKCKNNVMRMKQEIAQLEANIINCESRKSQVTDPQNMKNFIDTMNKTIKGHRYEIGRIKIKCDIQQMYLKQIHQINFRIMHILNETWLQTIEPNFKGAVTQKMLRTRSYAFLYRLHQELNRKLGQGRQEITFPYQQTSRLFEFYNVLLFIELLQKQGYKWTKGWLLDDDYSESQFYTLEQGEMLTFENILGHTIRLTYDKMIRKSDELDMMSAEAQLVSSSSNSSRRPDILLEFFKDNQFKSCMVVEVKYRKLAKLYNKNVQTDIMKQLVDYRQFDYFDPKSRPMMRSGIVDSILVIYPVHKSSKLLRDYRYDFQFIPISPIGYDHDTEGVAQVEQALVEFLNRQQ